MKNLSRSARFVAMAAVTLVISACSSDTVTAPSAASKQVEVKRAARMTGWTLPATGALDGGGSFAGTVTVNRFDVNAARELVVTGVLTGTVTLPDGTTETVSQAFADVATLSKTGSAPTTAAVAAAALDGSRIAAAPAAARTCDILFLDIGPISLDLLGLTVDLSQIVLDVNAVAGAGNLLGNLLCAVVGLFDGVAVLAAIQNLLDLINGIIGGAL